MIRASAVTMYLNTRRHCTTKTLLGDTAVYEDLAMDRKKGNFREVQEQAARIVFQHKG